MRLLSILSIAAICAAVAVSGCKPPERDRCTVEGKAFFKGEPLTGFHMALFSEATGGGGAEIMEGGAFKLYGPMQEGEYTAYFIISSETKGAAREKLEAVNLPVRYRRAETSDIKVKIVPGNNVLDLEPKP